MSSFDAQDLEQPVNDVSTVFRVDALNHHEDRYDGKPLRLSPRWVDYSFGVLALCMLAAVIFAIVGKIHEYAKGPAIVRLEGRDVLLAPTAGAVHEVYVEPGEYVEPNQLLVTLDAVREHAALNRIEKEEEVLLRRTLANPHDAAASERLSALAAQELEAQALLDAREIRAAVAGIVGDIRVVRGQRLNPGDAVASITPGGAPANLVAFLPGAYRPLLRPGQKLRLELEGFPHQYFSLTVDRVSSELVGPAEARRLLGPELADTLPVEGPITIVHASLQTDRFDIGANSFRFHDGMPARASVIVRQRSIALSLIPGLSALFRSEVEVR